MSDKHLKVVPLDKALEREKKSGRPKKLEMPALPQALFDGMTELERAHFFYFVDAYREEYPDLTPTDVLNLHMAGLEYISYLRIQAQQISTGEVISQARQHPGVQMRALLDQLSVTRKQRQQQNKGQDDRDKQAARELFASLSHG
ncbi:hypothetical protein [Ktedonospora formicarum]|uniref:Uncharacterized protein n=1 Tax=Ktedonospora formicarum TaxID=2778364 RepID=A0A8J3I0Q6_9CHLR|nr:hypothetical protein [Ktedonospora formicarum]GHO44543.1 hypothetical protein KSX_27060 [Ktedonospora formicarum]